MFRSPQLVFRCANDLRHLSGPKNPAQKGHCCDFFSDFWTPSSLGWFCAVFWGELFLLLIPSRAQPSGFIPVPKHLSPPLFTHPFSRILPSVSGHCKSSSTHSACPCLAHKCNGVLPSTSLCFNKTAFCLRSPRWWEISSRLLRSDVSHRVHIYIFIYIYINRIFPYIYHKHQPNVGQ